MILMAQPSSLILVDINGLGFSAQSGKRLFAGSVETTAVHRVLWSLKIIRGLFAGRIIALWDGRSWRHEHLSTYKNNRESNPKAVEMRQAWRNQRPLVQKMLPNLNVAQMTVGNWEADDLAGYLTARAIRMNQEVLLVSADRDWLQLLEPGVMMWDHSKSSLITEGCFSEIMDLPSPKALVEFKALAGDSSDRIPGVGGIGEKTARALLNRYGSVKAFIDAMQDESERKTADRRALKLLERDTLTRLSNNINLIQLNSPICPKPVDIHLVPGRFDLDALRLQCEELAFHKLISELPHWAVSFSLDR